MQAFTFLHIVSMFAAVTLAHASAWFIVYATRRRDLGALRAIERVSGRADTISFMFVFMGVAFGLSAAVSGSISLTASWLIAAYVLFVVGLVAGFASLPYTNRLFAAVRDNADEEPTPELVSLMASPVPLLFAIESGTVVVLIIAVMVFKPSLF